MEGIGKIQIFERELVKARLILNRNPNINADILEIQIMNNLDREEKLKGYCVRTIGKDSFLRFNKLIENFQPQNPTGAKDEK